MIVEIEGKGFSLEKGAENNGFYIVQDPNLIGMGLFSLFYRMIVTPNNRNFYAIQYALDSFTSKPVENFDTTVTQVEPVEVTKIEYRAVN